MSISLWPHGLQHASLPCPSTSPRIWSNSCPLSQSCHPTISPAPSPQSFPESGSFPVSWPFASGDQSTGTSASASVLPMNLIGLISFEIDLFDLLPVQGTLKSAHKCCNLKASILWCSVFFMVQLSQPHMTTGKAIALTMQTFVGKMMSLLFNTLSRYCWTIRLLASQSQELGVLVIFISHIWTIILSVNTDVVGKKSMNGLL